MTIWYRASKSENSLTTFSGDGGLFVSGRWNSLGKKVIYCSETIALCTLEWLSQNGLSVAGFNYYKYSIEVPDELTIKFTTSDLPKEWDLTPSSDITREFADENLFSSKQFIAMAVPSVIIPEEYNLVINPLHSQFQTIAKSIKELGKFIAPDR